MGLGWVWGGWAGPGCRAVAVGRVQARCSAQVRCGAVRCGVLLAGWLAGWLVGLLLYDIAGCRGCGVVPRWYIHGLGYCTMYV